MGPERGRREVTADGRKWCVGVLQEGPTPSPLERCCLGVQWCKSALSTVKLMFQVVQGSSVPSQLQSWHFWVLQCSPYSILPSPVPGIMLVAPSITSAFLGAGHMIMDGLITLVPLMCDLWAADQDVGLGLSQTRQESRMVSLCSEQATEETSWHTSHMLCTWAQNSGCTWGQEQLSPCRSDQGSAWSHPLPSSPVFLPCEPMSACME